MALFEELLEGGNVVTALVVGVGAAVAAPVVMPILRPVVKAGLVAYDQGRAAVSELSDKAEDLVAEARQEMATEGVSEGSRTGRHPGHGKSAHSS